MACPLTPRGRAAVLAAALLASAATCSDGEGRDDAGPATPAEPDRPTPTLRLLVVTDLQGTLEPCGCQSRPLGGIDKMAARIAAERADGVPTVFVAAGDLLFGPGDHGGAGSHAGQDAADKQQQWKAEALADVLGGLELAAATPGAMDLSHGVQRLAALGERVGRPLLAAGLGVAEDGEGGEGGEAGDEGDGGAGAPGPKTGDEDEPRPWAASRVHRSGELQVGIVGVSAVEHTAGRLPPGVQRSAAPLEAARHEAARLRERGVDLLVALVHGTRQTARQLAAEVEGLDFVVQGGLSEPQAIPPVDVGGTLVLHAGRQGQGLLVVDVWRRGDGGWSDIGRWQQQRERRRLEQRRSELAARIARWEKDDGVADADLARQRARLARMKAQITELEAPRPLPKEANAVAARWVELAAEAPSDDAVAERITRYYRRVNEHNRRALADLEPPPVEEGEPEYVGSGECARCHRDAYEWWQETPHGRAYATLEQRHKQFNLDCVGCHVTGYGEPGGSTVTHVEQLTNVGCESCHGPGSLHADDPSPPHSVRREVPERDCVQCHNEEHSDLFDYRAYRAVLLVPGHGKPLEP